MAREPLLSSAEFLSLTHPIDTQRWQLDLTSKLSGGRGSLFGGAGLAAGIVAFEHATNKPAIWATGQYLSLTQLGERDGSGGDIAGDWTQRRPGAGCRPRRGSRGDHRDCGCRRKTFDGGRLLGGLSGSTASGGLSRGPGSGTYGLVFMITSSCDWREVASASRALVSRARTAAPCFGYACVV